MKGFFAIDAGVSASRKPLSLLPACGACGLFRHKDCRTPKMPIWGQGKRKILIVGEIPGKQEDGAGEPILGKAGAVLKASLKANGVDLFRDCWVTNALICKGPKHPSGLQIEHCRPNLIKAITELKPEVVILLGNAAIRSAIGWLWKEDIGSALGSGDRGQGRWDGWVIPSQKINSWICPTLHPFYDITHPDRKGQMVDNPIRRMLFDRHISQACNLSGRPWDPIPDFRKKVKSIYDPAEAANAIYRLVESGRPLAFDLETDRLKPDAPDAEIVCCSMSDGKESIAFLWYGEAIKAMKAFVVSPVIKIGYNAKFENRWIRSKLGVWVENWHLDGMLGAHAIDNRAETKSLKFQAFIRLGMDSYDEEIKPYLKADGGGNAKNRIREAPVDKLLLYCGLDSYLEWKIGKQMAIEVGRPL